MTDTLLATLAIIDSYLWGPWTMAFLAGVAVFFTLTSGVFQLTGVCYIWRSTLGRLAASGDRAERQQMTPFQAAATSLAGTVGMGNMAGVAVSEAIKQGMARGMLSNEAGMGTAPMVHATADTEHPFQQGVWGAVEVFFDTIVICSITALAILSTGAMASGESGIELLLVAFSEVFSPSVAALIVSGAIATFCLSTQIGFYVYFETSFVSLVGEGPFRVLRWIYFLPGIAVAGVADVDRMWLVANIAVAVTAIPNLLAMLSLSGVFRTLMRDELSGERVYATAVMDRTGPMMRGYGATGG